MGMAASQARLLALTSRITDVEFKAQQLQNQKLALATQKDELYERYCAALDATKIRVAFNNGDGSREYLNANFNNVCTYNPDRFRQYALQDNRSGLAIVTDEVKNVYENYGGDKYSFAWKMLGFNDFNWLGESATDNINDYSVNEITGKCIGYNSQTNRQENFSDSRFAAYDNDETTTTGRNYTDGNILAMSEAEIVVFEEYCRKNPGSTLEALFENWRKALDDDEPTNKKREALDLFRETLYTQCGNQLYNSMNRNKQSNDRAEYIQISDKEWNDYREEFNYYVNLWEFIEESGGCTTIDAQYKDGDKGENWFNNMIESGLVSIHEFNTDKEWKETSVSTSTNNNYLREEQDDTDLKKAEIEYENELDIINRKDKNFDTQLSKLETEREAITKEMEQLKKIRKENSDKSFGIFS